MTLKTARTKLRLTEIESLKQTGRNREAANEAGSRAAADGSGRPAAAKKAGWARRWSSATEGDAMPYRDSGTDSTIGLELTQAREAAGLEIADVAAQLRIRQEFLAALEDGRPDLLPGKTYAIGYVRTYAAFLGLDVERAVTRFKQEAAGLDQRTQLVFPSPAPEGRVPGVSLMFASVLLAGLAYGGWYWMSERGMSVYDMVPDVPERLATLIEGQPKPESGKVASAPIQGSGTTASSSSSPATSSQAPASSVVQPSAQQTAAAPDSAVPATADSVYSAANPTSVPVTARSSSGETAPAPAAATALPAPTPPTANEGQAASAISISSAPLTETETTPATDPAPSVAVAAAPVDTVEDVPAADPSPLIAPTGDVRAADAPAPTQALAAPPPVSGTAQASSNPVPSAPRLSSLIGASEAAVPGAATNPAPATIERVVVRATGESWVQVRDEDGSTLFTRVLRSGDVYRVPDRAGLTLATGNAGALEIVVDGKPTPSLGTFGEVVRNIALEPERLAAGTAVAGRN